MPMLDTVNYLVVYPNGDLTLWQDAIADNSIVMSLYDLNEEPLHFTDVTLRDMLDGIHIEGTRLYVWEDWRN